MGPGDRANTMETEMSDSSFGFADVKLVGAGQLTAVAAGASPVVAAGGHTPQQAPPSDLNGTVVVGGGNLLTSHNGLFDGALNPSNNLFNPGHQ